MLIPPKLRPGVAVPPRSSRPPAIRYRIRGVILLLRVLLLCFHTAAHADTALPPVPASAAAQTASVSASTSASAFLEAVAVDYANSQLFHAVEGIAPVRQPRAERNEPAPASQAPAPATAVIRPPSGNLRRVNAQ